MRPACSISTARFIAACGQALVQAHASAICSPTVYTGFSEVIGSWKIIAISLARILLHLLAGQRHQVRPCHSTCPATILPGGMSISFITVLAVTLLPQPDSPTTPTVSPASMGSAIRAPCAGRARRAGRRR
jgi:hypothetical protein